MNFEDIYCFFRNPPPLYLNQELAVCYILDILLQGDSYGTELIARLERESSTYRLSDTVLYSAIKFLEANGTIVGYWKKVEGRGRPRRMYQIEPDWINKARELAHFWERYSHAHSTSTSGASSFDSRALSIGI
jgi:DNA-binding PadR family transcriptional regulator